MDGHLPPDFFGECERSTSEESSDEEGQGYWYPPGPMANMAMHPMGFHYMPLPPGLGNGYFPEGPVASLGSAQAETEPLDADHLLNSSEVSQSGLMNSGYFSEPVSGPVTYQDFENKVFKILFGCRK